MGEQSAGDTTVIETTEHDRADGRRDRGPSVSGGLITTSDGEAYRIDGAEHLEPFLMTVVSDTDLWMFVSSTGALTAGRRNADHALFPYETDDRLHRAAGQAGPVTVVARELDDRREVWQPFAPFVTPGCTRSIAKSVLGDRLDMTERNDVWGVEFRASWAPSDRFGWVRTAGLRRVATPGGADPSGEFEILDGFVDVMPAGIDAFTEQIRSNLADAYKRSEVVGGGPLAVYSLESAISDRAEPLEALTATAVWSFGLDTARLSLDDRAVGAMIGGRPHVTSELVTGRRGAYLLRGPVSLDAAEGVSWTIVADTDLDHVGLVDTTHAVAVPEAPAAVEADVAAGSARLAQLLAAADGYQHTGDPVADAHHLSNVLFNCMRGGTFPFVSTIPIGDLARFVHERNRTVAARHRDWLESLGDEIDLAELRAAADRRDDPDLVRLVLEYLPLSFSRRHGDPSRPWNRFSIDVRDHDGRPRLSYEGNWRDIFQNWEALLASFPAFFPNVVATFLNATTIEGYNPYRISRHGIDWEVPDPDDPWSHIGYWGDHQIVYLLRLLEMWERHQPGAITSWIDRDVFVHAEVPYRLADHDDIVANPRDTITYDVEHAEAIARREGSVGADGRLLVDPRGERVRVGLVEKLIVPALAKLSNYVPGGGIWLNTQRPEWNDANNALAGPGLSMVTTCQLRRYLAVLPTLLPSDDVDVDVIVSDSVARWFDDVRRVLDETSVTVVDDTERRRVIDALGRSAEDHRHRVRNGQVDRTGTVAVAEIVHLCRCAVAHLDATIAGARRSDGLYESYNRISFPSADVAVVDRLGPMLEGQVAVISSGALDVDEALDVVDALFDSTMYRADQDTLLLYPAAELAPFIERNVVSDDAVERLRAVRPEIVDAVAARDADGSLRFRSTIVNAKALDTALDPTGATSGERELIADVYESVVDHRSFTGRSGRMHGYEGIGSVYWHMVAKLLVAVQEQFWDAELPTGADRPGADGPGDGANAERRRRLIGAYRRVRRGLGFEKTPAVYGAFPTDCYSHTPAHSGAQQPGMTGQVKEEIITRVGELGLRVAEGRVWFAPGLLGPDDVLGAGGDRHERPAARMTLCGVPIDICEGDHDQLEIVRDGVATVERGHVLGEETSSVLFARDGSIESIRIDVGPETLDRWRRTG